MFLINGQYDLEKIRFFLKKPVFSDSFIQEFTNQEISSYFQKDYTHYYYGIVSYKVVIDEWRKIKKDNHRLSFFE